MRPLGCVRGTVPLTQQQLHSPGIVIAILGECFDLNEFAGGVSVV